MKEGTVPDCLTVEALQNQQKIGMNDLFLAYSMSTPFGAGIETVCYRHFCFDTKSSFLMYFQTAGTLMTFIRA